MSTEIENPTEPVPSLRPRVLPPPLQPLEPLSWNYWWSWAPDGAEVFRDLDPDIWQQCEQNPRMLLAHVSDLRLAQMAADPIFVDRVQRVSNRFSAYLNDTQAWPQLHV